MSIFVCVTRRTMLSMTQPFAREFRWRMVAKADSITLAVHGCVQCAAGKSQDASRPCPGLLPARRSTPQPRHPRRATLHQTRTAGKRSRQVRPLDPPMTQ